jgi:hypothetical protein
MRAYVCFAGDTVCRQRRSSLVLIELGARRAHLAGCTMIRRARKGIGRLSRRLD